MTIVIVTVLVIAGVISGTLWLSRNHSNTKNQSTDISSAVNQTPQLQVTDETVGSGAVAETGKSVTVNYIGTLGDGTKFDSSYDRNQPFSFTLGSGQVIRGWDQGVVGMKVGGKRKLVIPPNLAYGADPPPGSPIPSNATLTFEIELLNVQ